MKKNSIILIILTTITLQTTQTIVQKFQKRLSTLRKSLFPTTPEILKIDQITNPFLKKTTKLMIDKKEDGIYLLYNLIYYNFLLNLNKFCLLRYPLSECNKFHAHANRILTNEITNEKNEVINGDINEEREEETVSRIEKIENQDFFNIASVYKRVFEGTGEEAFDAFLERFREEFEEKDEGFGNDADTLLGMYQENLETLNFYLNEERIDEAAQIKKLIEMEESDQNNYQKI